MNTNIPPEFRCGYIAIIGEPNVGKSTFLNTVLDIKLSIISSKPQTTRRQVLGLLSTEKHQVIFLDTPGLIKPKYVLQEAMMLSARSALADADGIVYLLDGKKILRRDVVIPTALVAMLTAAKKPLLVIINKTDLFHHGEEVRYISDKLKRELPAAAVMAMSALRKDGIDEVVEAIVNMLPIAPALYPDDVLSDLPQRFFISEIIREKIFQLFQEEIPYAAEVAVVTYTEKEDIDHIAAEIIVERESQRKIMIGAKGQGIKSIGMAARRDIEKFVGKKVFLDLHVKIRKDWRNDKAWVQRFGYKL